MATISHLWAIGYDDVARAGEVREIIAKIGWDESCLILEDIAVVVRHADGTFTINRNPMPALKGIASFTIVGFIAGLVTLTPLTNAAVGALIGGALAATSAAAKIDPGFVQDVERLMKPGTSALFVLDDEGDMKRVLQTIQGLGGTVLKTNVDVERVKLVQSTLNADAAKSSD
jgi:uncharacterized membrane protein